MAGAPRWRSAAARVHGGPVAEELRALGLDAHAILDFSVNVNPYGPSPAVLHAIRTAPVDRYPDSTAAPVRQALAARLEVAAERIVFGSGAAELLWVLARVLLAGGGHAVVVEPAFSEFRAAVLQAGGAVSEWRAHPAHGLTVDLDAVSEAVGRERADAVYLCAPTTPAGIPVPADDVARLASRHEDAIVILDESFLPLSDRHGDALRPLPDNVVRVRSMTKEHAMPGLRAGYLVAPPALAAAVETARPAWSTSSVAQAAAIAAAADGEFVTESRGRLRRDREELAAGLRALGLAPLPSIAPYLAFAAADAVALRRRILARGVLVRDCTSFGLRGWLRVAARPAADRARLLAALEQELR